MKRLLLPLTALALVAGCGGSSVPAAEVKAAQNAGPTGKKVTLHDSDYGRILADGKGRALYLFTKDDEKSRCYGDCAKAWPPFITKGKPRARGNVKADLLGTVKRRNGKKQVTYKGHPLYYYVGDTEPGQVLCQAVLEYGGYWYVVKRSGEPVK